MQTPMCSVAAAMSAPLAPASPDGDPSTPGTMPASSPEAGAVLSPCPGRMALAQKAPCGRGPSRARSS